MRRSADALRVVALRVLTALMDGQRPDAADIRRLITYAPSGEYTLDQLDELACEVIQQALKDRAQVHIRRSVAA
jgi:hypothetical protein